MEGEKNVWKNVHNMDWRPDLRHPDELSEEERHLENGAEWIPRSATERLAVLRTHRQEYPKYELLSA